MWASNRVRRVTEQAQTRLNLERCHVSVDGVPPHACQMAANLLGVILPSTFAAGLAQLTERGVRVLTPASFDASCTNCVSRSKHFAVSVNRPLIAVAISGILASGRSLEAVCFSLTACPRSVFTVNC